MNLKSIKIAIVDDDITFSELTIEILKHAGFRNLIVYNNPVKAFNEISNESLDTMPAVIISDYTMQEMTGIELLDKVSTLYPVYGIIISAHPELVSSDRYPILAKVIQNFRKRLVEKVSEAAKTLV